MSREVAELRNEIIEVRERHEVEGEPIPAAIPVIMELLHTILERLPPEDMHEPPPSYHTRS